VKRLRDTPHFLFCHFASQLGLLPCLFVSPQAVFGLVGNENATLLYSDLNFYFRVRWLVTYREGYSISSSLATRERGSIQVTATGRRRCLSETLLAVNEPSANNINNNLFSDKPGQWIVPFFINAIWRSTIS
jgi:hypothetical protein